MSYTALTNRFVTDDGRKHVSAAGADGRLLQACSLVLEWAVANASADDATSKGQALANIITAVGGRDSGLGSRIMSVLNPEERRLAEPLL